MRALSPSSLSAIASQTRSRAGWCSPETTSTGSSAARIAPASGLASPGGSLLDARELEKRPAVRIVGRLSAGQERVAEPGEPRDFLILGCQRVERRLDQDERAKQLWLAPCCDRRAEAAIGEADDVSAVLVGEQCEQILDVALEVLALGGRAGFEAAPPRDHQPPAIGQRLLLLPRELRAYAAVDEHDRRARADAPCSEPVRHRGA